MTTINFDLVRIGYDGDDNPNAYDVIGASATFHADLSTLTYSVDALGQATIDSQFFAVEFADGAQFQDLVFVIGAQAWSTNTGQTGTTELLYFVDPETGVEYYGAIGGDAFPVSSLQDILDLEFDAVGDPALLTGDRAPGQNILPTLTLGDPAFSNIRIVEDDTYNIASSESYFAFGGAGDDVFNGIDGQWDYVIYQDLGAAVDVNLLRGWAKKDGLGRDVLNSVEDIHGTAFDDRIVGDNNAEGNFFFGGDGNDIIRGKGADDRLAGEDGDDKIFGDDGEDLLEGGNGEDRIEGGAGNDSLSGGNQRDVMRGNQDNDQLFGGNGDDRLLGGTGSDSLYGENGDDDIFGQAGDDYIQGDDGIDRIDGGRDDDRIDGGADNDFLFGGAGNDVFVFEDIEDMGRDRIKDWQDGRDQVDLTGYGFTDFADVQAIAEDTGSGLRLLFADDSDGDTRAVFIENFLKANFDASDVILDVDIA